MKRNPIPRVVAWSLKGYGSIIEILPMLGSSSCIGFPIEISEWVLDESEEILEESSLVASIGELLAELSKLIQGLFQKYSELL
jgi:hypothetical protein